jgi:two-component system response regulator FixJ
MEDSMNVVEEKTVSTSRPVIYIIDDDPGIREGLRMRVESETLTAQTFSSAEAFLEEAETLQGGCIIIDLYMQRMTGIELLQKLRSTGCEVPVILISGMADLPTAVQGMKLGAVDFLQKPVSPDALLLAIRSALSHADHQNRRKAERTTALARFSRLSLRELDVLAHVMRGESSKQIARQLGISAKTVSHHRANIVSKSGATNTADVVRLAQFAQVCTGAAD